MSDLELLVALCDYVMLTSGPSSMSEDGTTAYLSLDALTDDDLLDEHACAAAVAASRPRCAHGRARGSRSLKGRLMAAPTLALTRDEARGGRPHEQGPHRQGDPRRPPQGQADGSPDRHPRPRPGGLAGLPAGRLGTNLRRPHLRVGAPRHARQTAGMNIIEPLVYTRREAAEACRVGVEVIDKAIHSGQLKAKKIGRRYIIQIEAVREWLDSRPAA